MVAHNFVGQWVIFTCEAVLIHAHAAMPVARHPSVTALDAHGLGVDVRKILVEADGTFAALI